MSLTKTRGVILRTINIREADRILEVYTDDLGKVRAVARGVRKIRSRLAGHLEPFTYVDLMLAQGRGDLPTIAGAKALEHYAGLRRDLKRVAVASYLAELVSRLTPDEMVSQRFPGLLREAFTLLDHEHDASAVGSYFEWRAIQTSGWEPQLRQCVHCNQKLFPQGLSFSVNFSGVLCKQCRIQDPEARDVSPAAVKLLRTYSERSFLESEGLLAPKGVRKETKRLIDQVVHQTLEREPKSRAFLAHMESV